MTDQLPENPFEVMQRLNYDEAIEDTDQRFVNLDEARGGSGIIDRLAVKFLLDLRANKLYPVPRKHVLLFGPIGCGKSTELLRFSRVLQENKKIFPILLNVRGEIDINNLQYADMLMALASALIKTFAQNDLPLDEDAIAPLKEWFREQIEAHEVTRELIGEINTSISAKAGIPYLAALLARITARFKNTSAYKESLRDVVQKSFSQFAQAFNNLVSAAEKVLYEYDKGERILLIVDGTDKIPRDQAERLFIEDSEQLLAINAYVLYTAPITLKYSGADHGKLDASEVLSIVKLYQRDGIRHEAGWSALRDLLRRRANPNIFDDERLPDVLIEASGGHPRELLRLLRQSCEYASSSKIDHDAVERAIAKSAADFRYWLQPEDYQLLADIDAAHGEHIGNDERVRNLLWRLALLHYNDGSWRLSHPAVRQLEGYKKAAALVSQRGRSDG